MKKTLYNYIKGHPESTLRNCAVVLNIGEEEALSLINTLRQEGYLKETVLPLGNSYDSNCSPFYSVRGEYKEE